MMGTALVGLATLGCVIMMAVMCLPMLLGALRRRRRNAAAAPVNPASPSPSPSPPADAATTPETRR